MGAVPASPSSAVSSPKDGGCWCGGAVSQVAMDLLPWRSSAAGAAQRGRGRRPASDGEPHGGQSPGASSEPPGSCASTLSTFKAMRPRKTKDFIGSVKDQEACRDEPWESEVFMDPRLLADADAREVNRRVATMILQHIAEGESTYAVRSPIDDEFDEDHFIRRPHQPRPVRCWPWSSPPKPEPIPTPQVSQEVVCRFVDDVATSLYFCKQVVVLCAVYIERLLHETPARLTARNWRSVVVVTLLIASKVWEDVHPWNADFEACLADVAGIHYQPGALYELESLLLDRLKWRVLIDCEVYAAYYFALVSGDLNPGESLPSASTVRRRWTTDNLSLDAILEDKADVEAAADDTWRGGGLSEAAPEGGRASPWANCGVVTPTSSETFDDMSRRFVDGGGGAVAAAKATRDAWRLDSRNPLVGALRHAPRAPAPSRTLPQSEILWENRLANLSADVFGPARGGGSSRGLARGEGCASTISGATGSELARELRAYLHGRDGPAATPESRPAKAPADIDDLFDDLFSGVSGAGLVAGAPAGVHGAIGGVDHLFDGLVAGLHRSGSGPVAACSVDDLFAGAYGAGAGAR